MLEIKKISVKNFRCFPNASLEFGKLTLITGANSSGKSSFMYSLLGALQTNGFPIAYSTNGNYVNLGGFSEIALGHNIDNEIAIGFSIKDGNDQYECNITLSKPSEGGLPVIQHIYCKSSYFQIKISGDLKGGKFLADLDYYPKKNPNKFANDEQFRKEGIVSIINNKAIDKKDANSLIAYLNAIGSEHHFTDEVFDAIDTHLDTGDEKEIKTLVVFQILNSIQALFKRFDERFNYISSYRSPAERTYLEKQVGNKIAPSGDGFVDILLKWKNAGDKKFDSLLAVLTELGLLKDIQIDRLPGGRYNVVIKMASEGVFSSLADVGFGVSQFLPVIIADTELGEGSTLFAAQPEIHLHPSIQADFANYLMKQVCSNNKRYVIETHSEYIINRIRLGIVKGLIAEEDVKVYFMSQEKGLSRVTPVSFNRKGQIIGAPDDFFQTYMMDVMDIAIEAVE